MHEFTDSIHPLLIGLTAEGDELQKLTQAFRVYFKIQKQDPNDKHYLIDHTAFSYLVFPKQNHFSFFGRQDSPQAVAQVAQCVAQSFGITS